MKKSIITLFWGLFVCFSLFSQGNVRVTLVEDGRSFTGRISSVSDSSIMLSNLLGNNTVNKNTERLTIYSNKINSIEFGYQKSSPEGMLLGALGGSVIGALAGFAVGTSNIREIDGQGSFIESSFKAITIYPLTGGVLGGLGGLILGAVLAKKTVYDPIYIFGKQENFERNLQLIKHKTKLMF